MWTRLTINAILLHDALDNVGPEDFGDRVGMLYPCLDLSIRQARGRGPELGVNPLPCCEKGPLIACVM
jgi:hypothetical protein